MTGFSIKLTVVCSVLTGLLMTRPAMAVTESDVISIGEKIPRRNPG